MRRSVQPLLCLAICLAHSAQASQQFTEPVTVTQLCTQAASSLQLCSQYTAYPESDCCKAMQAIQELGCLCMESTQEAARSALSPSVWRVLPLCKLAEDVKLDSHCNSSSGAKSIPSDPAVISVPGKGFVKASYLQNELESRSHSRQLGRKQLQEVVQVETANGAFPVLDLSTIPDDVTFIVSTDEASDMVVVAEDSATGEVTYTFDVDLPGDLLLDGVELSLDITDDDDVDSKVTVEVEGDFSSFTELKLAGEVLDGSTILKVESDSEVDDIAIGIDISDDDLVYQLSSSEGYDEELIVEMNVEVPEDTFEPDAGAADVTIEVEFDFDGEDSISETAITVENDPLHFPMTGRGLGNLLMEAAEWLAAYIPIPLNNDDGEYDDLDDLQESLAMAGLMEEALRLMSDIGEEISEALPDEELLAGDTIEVVLEEGDWSPLDGSIHILDNEIIGEPEKRVMLSGRKSMDSLTEAVSSELSYKQDEQKTTSQAVCSLCEFVHRHLRLLWSIVYVNLVLLAVCLAAAAYRIVRPYKEAPTIPDADLKEPLIIHAADHASPLRLGEQEYVLSADWAPPQKLQQ